MVEIYNPGAVDISNSWTVGGRTHHMDLQKYFMCEVMVEQMLTIWRNPGYDSNSDIFSKNVVAVVFNCHILHYVWHDKYMQTHK